MVHSAKVKGHRKICVVNVYVYMCVWRIWSVYVQYVIRMCGMCRGALALPLLPFALTKKELVTKKTRKKRNPKIP
ncbi:MAG: hypothetical protein J3R72DRAFT_460775 [Linnemannia gamsii]|nr:MAG: hypothetical protein J3R72DRAFT_460775 [Linnemannia gamsii]